MLSKPFKTGKCNIYHKNDKSFKNPKLSLKIEEKRFFSITKAALS